MNVYLVRHGQSEGNLKGQYQGPEVSLSPEGIEQAKILAKRLKNIPINIIYASPFTRAKQTAEIIAKELSLPIEYWEDLRERKRPSELEGLNTDDPKAIEIKDQIAKNWLKGNWKYSDDESFEDLKNRGQTVIKNLVNKHREQDVLCVSHGTIMKMIVSWAIFGNKLTPEVFWEFDNHTWNQNTGITHLGFTDKYGWSLLTWNDTTHL